MKKSKFLFSIFILSFFLLFNWPVYGDSFFGGGVNKTQLNSNEKGLGADMIGVYNWISTKLGDFFRGKYVVKQLSSNQGDVNTPGTLAYIINEAGSNKVIINLTGDFDYHFSTNLTIPANISLDFGNGARLSPDSGITITFSGSPDNQIIASKDQQIKTGSGTLSFAIPGDFYADWIIDPTGGNVTSEFQEAVNMAAGGRLNLCSGDTYMINTSSGSIQNVQCSIIGHGAKIVNADITNYAFIVEKNTGSYYEWDLYDYEITGFELDSKYGISVNTDTTWTGMGTEPAINGLKITNLILAGSKDNASDVNQYTTVIPAHTDIDRYGVGLKISKGFNIIIEGNYIKDYGIGLDLYGTDISTIHMNRFARCSNAIWITGNIGSSFGSQDEIIHNDILNSYRYGAIRNDSGYHMTYTDNFFEDPNHDICYIYDDGTYTIISKNRFADTNSTTAPLVDLAPKGSPFTFINNTLQVGTGRGIDAIKIEDTNFNDNFDASSNYSFGLGLIEGNSGRWNVTGSRYARKDTWSKYLWSVDNPQEMGGTGGIVSPIFTLDNNNNVYFHEPAADSTYIFFHNVNLRNDFLVKFKGMYNSQEGYVTINAYWYDNTGTAKGPTALYTGHIGFINNGKIQTIDLPVDVHSLANLGNIYKIAVEIWGTQDNTESIEIIPNCHKIFSSSVLYDFSDQGGAVGNIALATIPDNCAITHAWYEVETPFGSSGSATIAFGIMGDDLTGLKTATAYNDTSFNIGYHDFLPTGLASTFTTKTTDARSLIMTIGTAALTAGKVKIWYQYSFE